MFILQLKLALRHLYRHRKFSLINLVGLSLGLASFVYVIVLIGHETGFDRFLPDTAHTYRVKSYLMHSSKTLSSGYCNAPVGPELAANLPGIGSFCRVTSEMDRKVISETADYSVERFRFADKNFFNFFGFKLIQGSPERVLDQPGAVVLSRSEAIRIFASENPVGKILKTPEGMQFVVTGVAEDAPSNTHLVFDAVASYESLVNQPGIYLEWGGGWTFLTYLRLSPGIDPDALAARFPAFLDNRINNKYRQSGWELKLALQPILDVHMNSGLDYDCPTNRSKTNLLIITTIALIILLLAIINYINLATAIAFTRIRETGMRKIMGADRRQIRIEMLAEAIILSLAAGTLALILITAFYPLLNQLTGTDFSPVSAPLMVVLIALGASVLTGLISGLAPALMLSRQEALRGVQHNTIGYGKQLLRNGLVTFQFFAAVVLMGTLILMEKQSSYINGMDLGFNRKTTGSLSISKGFTAEEGARILDELKKIPGIESVCLSSEIPGAGVTANGYGLEGRENREIIRTIYADENFLDCFGIKLLKGRNFHGTSGADGKSLIINRAMADFAGWQDPLGKFITRGQTYEVIGVVDNFHFASVYEPVAPLIISVNPAVDSWLYHNVNIRYNTSDLSGLLNRIRTVEESVMPGQLFEFQFLDDYISDNYHSLDQNRKMVTLFTIIAILIASIGLFGLSAFITVSRRKEIGIRKVNGASTSQILILLNYRMTRWVLAGFIVACPVALVVMDRWLRGFAFKTSVSWWILATAGLAVLVIAGITVSWESFRAARRNPVETLHHE